MAMEHENNMPSSGSTMPPRDSTMHDRDTMNTTGTNTVYDRDSRAYDRDAGGSNFLAFLIGGLVIALGLMAFLFYDGGSTRDVTTTGSTTPRVETPPTPSAPRPTQTAPASPGAPATPAR